MGVSTLTSAVSFHPNKCSVLTVNHRLTTSKHKYSLYDHVLENASSAKYLGVTLQHNAQFNQHIDTVVAKVNRTLGCWGKTWGSELLPSRHKPTSPLCTPSLSTHALCGILPHTKDSDKLEAIQHEAVKFALNWHQRTASARLLLQGVDWPSLSDSTSHTA